MSRHPTDFSKLPELPFLASFVLADGKQLTSEAFQLYNFLVAIGFLAFGLHLTSGVMMVINLINAIIRLDLGLSNCNVEKLLSRSKVLIGLSSLTFCYLGLLRSAGVTFSSEGFTWCGLTMLFLATAMETHVLDICLLTSHQRREQRRIVQLILAEEDEETSHRAEEDLLTEYVFCGVKR